jgi:hypothetical protein
MGTILCPKEGCEAKTKKEKRPIQSELGILVSALRTRMRRVCVSLESGEHQEGVSPEKRDRLFLSARNRIIAGRMSARFVDLSLVVFMPGRSTEVQREQQA